MTIRRIRSLLIANRGEIACRVAATARRLGIESVVLVAADDGSRRHARVADRTIPIPVGGHLDAEGIVSWAKAAGVDAVHPGYGFLAENSEFAALCESSELIFVGPSSSSMRLAGDKLEASRLASSSGIPTLGSEAGDDARSAASRTGFPLMIKAAAGGGGKGMREVLREEDFDESLESCRREAFSAFGDGRVLLERRLANPRHVEVQLLADAHGKTVALFDRDCSTQRRHQKLLEESPAPHLSSEMRGAMAKSAVAFAESVGYRNAGTAEFLVDGDSFYFLEMNARLQVEHPVTEMVTGLDLVEHQLRVADGQPLDPALENLGEPRGHAIEARLCSEDPSADFLPRSGRLLRVAFPEGFVEAGEGSSTFGSVRVDSGVDAGDVIGLSYDSLFAKLIVHGKDRADALRLMESALASTEILGVSCNVDFLRRCVGHESFRKGGFGTGFVSESVSSLLPDESSRSRSESLAARALRFDLGRSTRVAESCSPWNDEDSRSLMPLPPLPIDVEIDGRTTTLTLPPPLEDSDCVSSATSDSDSVVRLRTLSGAEILMSDADDGARAILVEGRQMMCSFLEPSHTPSSSSGGGGGEVRSPMPGRLLRLDAREGDRATRGERLAVLEAMKMERAVLAEIDGVIDEVCAQEGSFLAEGDVIVRIKPS